MPFKFHLGLAIDTVKYSRLWLHLQRSESLIFGPKWFEMPVFAHTVIKKFCPNANICLVKPIE